MVKPYGRTDAVKAKNLAKVIMLMSVIMAVTAAAKLANNAPNVTSTATWSLVIASVSAILCILWLLTARYRDRLGLDIGRNYLFAAATGLLALPYLWSAIVS